MEEKQDYLQDKVMLQKKLDETKQLALQEKMRAEKASRVGEEAAQKGRAETGELVKLYEDNKRLAEENEVRTTHIYMPIQPPLAVQRRPCVPPEVVSCSVRHPPPLPTLLLASAFMPCLGQERLQLSPSGRGDDDV